MRAPRTDNVAPRGRYEGQRWGAMVAYQGQVQFQALGSGGMSKWIKSKLTGEGVPLMKMSGRGDVFLAERTRVRAEPQEPIDMLNEDVEDFRSDDELDLAIAVGHSRHPGRKAPGGRVRSLATFSHVL